MANEERPTGYALYSRSAAVKYGVDIWESFNEPGKTITATRVFKTMEELNNYLDTDGKYRGPTGKYVRRVDSVNMVWAEQRPGIVDKKENNKNTS